MSKPLPPVRNEAGLLCRCEGDWFCRALTLGGIIEAQAARLAELEPCYADSRATAERLIIEREQYEQAVRNLTERAGFATQRADALAARLAAVDTLVTFALYYRVLQHRGGIGTYGSRPIARAIDEALDALLASGSYADAVAALDAPTRTRREPTMPPGAAEGEGRDA
jgi:hypothetical protein